MKTIVFIVPSIDDSHYRNRIIEFIEKGYEVRVYGFCRCNKERNLPYSYKVLGNIENASYSNRVRLYIQSFNRLGKKYKDTLFYLCGLDIAMSFRFINPSHQYIYEECDLVHTYMGQVKYLLEWIDKRIIKKSLLTITTSEGFINYHFKGVKPDNVCLVENKLNHNIIGYKIQEKPFDKDNLSIGFVGLPRFDSVYNFIDVYCRNFPQYTFHVFGGPVSDKFNTLKKYPNCKLHGFFNNPADLPEIYGTIDVVLSTYDTKYENVRYAEPNKIYESIYFETPIIVSSNTFLAEKVKRLGIGFDIDAMSEVEIVNFVSSLNNEIVNAKSKAAKDIDKRNTLNINEHLFKCLEERLAQFGEYYRAAVKSQN